MLMKINTESRNYFCSVSGILTYFEVGPNVEHPWHVEQCDEPVQPLGRVQHVVPEVQTKIITDLVSSTVFAYENFVFVLFRNHCFVK